MKYTKVPFEALHGKTVERVDGEPGGVEMRFLCTDGSTYLLRHEQEGFESVYIESISGDLQSICGHVVLKAEEVTKATSPKPRKRKKAKRGHFTSSKRREDM